MSIAVKVPTILRTYTGGAADVTVEGATLSEALADLDRQYPGIGARVLDESGKLRRFVNVYVNDDDVRFLEDLATPTPAGSSVSIIPAVAGG
jgi:molybdopterin converting factor small subunit